MILGLVIVFLLPAPALGEGAGLVAVAHGTPLASAGTVPAVRHVAHAIVTQPVGRTGAAMVRVATGAARTWSTVATGVGPSVRGSTAIASSPTDNVTLLFSGAHPGSFVDNETWELANGTWHDLTPTLSLSPPPAADAGLVYDAADGYFLMFGGLPAFGGTASAQTWKFQGGNWTNLTGTITNTPPARFGAAMVYDARDGYVVMFGGYDATNSPLGDTWTYLAGAWTQVTPAVAPSPRTYMAATYDPRLGAAVIFGGQVYSATQLVNDTWEFSAGTWTNITATSGTAPGGRRGPTMAYDPTYGIDVLFGGNNYSYGITYNDTWALAAGHWVNITPFLSASLAPRFLAVSTFDPSLGGVVVFGGCASTGCTTALNDTGRLAFDLGAPALNPSATMVAANATLRLTSTAEGGSMNYSYAYAGLPGGCISANVSVLVCRPDTPGNFTPTVTITDTFAPAGTTSARVNATSANIEVLPPLVIAAGVSRSSLDVGQTVWINSSAAGGGGTRTYSYSGLPTGCTSANVPSLACAPQSSGSANVTVSVHDTTGGSSTTDVSFLVLPRLVAFVHASAAEVEVGQTVSFTASTTGGSGGVSYAWPSLPAGCSLVVSAMVNCTPALPGLLNLSVQANDSNGGVSVGDSGRVLIVAQLSAVATTTPGSGVAPLSVTYTSNVHGGIPPYTYLWLFGDGTNSTAANATHIYTTPGTFTVAFRVEDAAGHWSNATLIVAVAPTPAVAVAASPTAIDVGQTATLSAVPSNLNGPLTYTWTSLPRGCSAANASSLTCAPLVSGNYSIHVTVSIPTGVSASGTTHLLVYPPLSASIVVGASSGCTCACGASYPVNFTAIAGGGASPYRYLWTFGDGGTATAPAPTHDYLATTLGATLTVNLTVNDSSAEVVTATANIIIPATSCGPAPGASGASTTPWLYPAIALVAVVIAAIAAAVLLWSRRRPPATAVPDEPASDGETFAAENPDAPLDPLP